MPYHKLKYFYFFICLLITACGSSRLSNKTARLSCKHRNQLLDVYFLGMQQALVIDKMNTITVRLKNINPKFLTATGKGLHITGNAKQANYVFYEILPQGTDFKTQDSYVLNFSFQDDSGDKHFCTINIPLLEDSSL